MFVYDRNWQAGLVEARCLLLCESVDCQNRFKTA